MEMKLLDAYDIPWKGLSNGCHDFDFEIDDRFFGEFGDSGIQGGRMKAEVRMEKSAAMLLLHVTIEGEVTDSVFRGGRASLVVDTGASRVGIDLPSSQIPATGSRIRAEARFDTLWAVAG